MPASVTNPMGGGSSETVELDQLDNIGAEQAALANREAAATAKVDEAAAQLKGTEKVEDDLSPAAKQAKAAEAAEEQTTSFDDFLKQKNTGDKAKTVVKPKVDDTKTEEELVAAQLVAKKATQQISTEARDLTGIAPEHQEYFKRMSNEAFNALKPMYMEKQQLAQELAETKKGALPANYYEHEQAYVLTPEFAQQSQQVSQAETILNHYTSQLQELRRGGESYTVLQRDAQGNLVVSQPIKADRNTVDQMADVRQAAYQQLLNAQAQLSTVGQLHKERAAEAKGWLNDFDSKAFPAFQQRPELKAMVDDTVKKMLHKSYHTNPLAPLFAKAVLVMQEQGKALAARGNVAPAKPAVKSGGPSAAEIASGGAEAKGGSDTGEVTMDMFNAAKKGLL